MKNLYIVEQEKCDDYVWMLICEKSNFKRVYLIGVAHENIPLGKIHSL